jgi:hypothetical protein
MKYCLHGLKIESCLTCSKPRSTQSLTDAWNVYRSGVGSWIEWSDCSEIFYRTGHDKESEECSLRAISSLGKMPGLEPIKVREVLSNFVRGRLRDDLISEQGKFSLRRIADRLADARLALGKLRNQLRPSGKGPTYFTTADSSLAETIMLANDPDRRRETTVQLAARFRKFDKFKQDFRWGKPTVALNILKEHLLLNPEDCTAFYVMASAQGDLGLWHEARKSSQTAVLLLERRLKLLEVPSKGSPVSEEARKRVKLSLTFALNTHGRVLLGLNLGMEAWEPLYRSYQLTEQRSVAAMLHLSCGIAAVGHLDARDRQTLWSRRAFVSGLNKSANKDEQKRNYKNLDRIAIQFLLFDMHFVEAILFVSEASREGRLDNGAFWNKEIDSAILQAGQSIPRIRAEASAVDRDLFPDQDE